jgi:predicted DNA-binding transcriptional regulator AlpA
MFTDAKTGDHAHQSHSLQSHGHRILRLSEVMHLTGYRRASLYAKTNRHSRQFDPTFHNAFP